MIPHSAVYTGTEEAEAAARVLASGQLAQGVEVEAFEKECAEAVGRRYGVAVSSGTNALHLVLRVLGVERDDPIAIPSYVCAALITALKFEEAAPVLCDCGPDYNVDPSTIPHECETAITVHLFGAQATLPSSMTVIEDIAQSFGGPTGAGSIAAVTSFYATKLMATGEGGMLFTDDESLAGQARDQRDYDNRDDFKKRFSYKMTDLQAAIGRVQLTRLPGFIRRRREIAREYDEAFGGLDFALPTGENHVYFRYVIATEQRDALQAHLRECGVDAKRPVYRPAHQYLGGDCPGAERAHRTALSIPIYPALIDADVGRVIESVRSF